MCTHEMLVVPVLFHAYMFRDVGSLVLLVLLTVTLIFFFLAVFRSVESDARKHCMACDAMVYDTWHHCLQCHRCVPPTKRHTRYGCLDEVWYSRHNRASMAVLGWMVVEGGWRLYAEPRLHITGYLVCCVLLFMDYNYQAGLLKCPKSLSWSRRTSTGTTSMSRSWV